MGAGSAAEHNEEIADPPMNASYLTLQPAGAQHVEDAARLFAAGYARLHQSAAHMPAQFDDLATIAPMLRNILRDHPGVVALERSTLAGYLTGYAAIPSFHGSAPGVYVPVWGHGVADGHDAASVFSALYSEMSAEWVGRDCHVHAISYFVHGGSRDRELEQLLFGLGFGLQVIDRMPSIASAGTPADDSLTYREACEDDLAAIQELDGNLCRHLRSAPIFLHTNSVPKDDLQHNFLRKGVKTFLACEHGTAVAGIRGVLNHGPGCELFDVPGSLGINFAYTAAESRRTGVGSRLLDELLKWGAAQGMVRCVVDYESANLLARRFWERHFRPICRSAIRKVDSRM